ncbi:MAG: hypothetical protein K9L60_11830 [Methylovulum sp.]|jgi:hypothetical protein|nr:hypothetical protein [Methylovulum sp.]MCF7999730.1 hypothetical protein [Methylovulum sp.]
MNKNLLLTTLFTTTAMVMSLDVLARPEYVQPTGAAGCTSCHNDNLGNGFKPGVIAATQSPQGFIAGLTAFLHPTTTTPDTKPFLHPINTKWDITVGEMPLTIPLQVTDSENDTFDLHGSAPQAYTVSKVYLSNNIPTINFTFTPSAAQANKVLPVSFYVKETGAGRTLSSNTVNATIQVWPARTSATKNVSQFALQGAQWKNNVLTLAGKVVYKSNLTAQQRAAAMAKLTMSLTSSTGIVISPPVKLTPAANGYWQKNINLSATAVPCGIKLNYEGLQAARIVSLAPAASCIK